jgi:hypothetical protein
MKTSNLFAIGLLTFAAAGVNAKQNSVVVLADESSRAGAKVASIDFEAGEPVSAFQMRLTLPADAKKINTANCLADLPKSHTGLCKASGNRVSLVVYSTDGKALSPGLVSVGRISYSTRTGGTIAVDKMMSAGPDARESAVKSRVESLN